MEEWKDLKGFETQYEISNTGKIKRKNKATLYKDGRVGYFSPNELKQGIDHKGYLRVYLSINSIKYTRRVHRLVALTFINNPLKKETVNHIDSNKLNNNVSNLEWNTNLENMRHAFKNGAFKERDAKNRKK